MCNFLCKFPCFESGLCRRAHKNFFAALCRFVKNEKPDNLICDVGVWMLAACVCWQQQHVGTVQKQHQLEIVRNCVLVQCKHEFCMHTGDGHCSEHPRSCFCVCSSRKHSICLCSDSKRCDCASYLENPSIENQSRNLEFNAINTGRTRNV